MHKDLLKFNTLEKMLTTITIIRALSASIYLDLITYLSRYPTCLYPDLDRHIRIGKKSNKVNNCRAILVIRIRITVSVTSVRETCSQCAILSGCTREFARFFNKYDSSDS